MLLEKTGQFNDLSDELRQKLTERINGFGKRVRYRFDISNPNPDPSKHNGTTLWPNVYTLDPTIFSINDPYEKTPGKSKSKRIALVKDTDPEKGHPITFHKIRVEGKFKGLYELNLEDNPDHFYFAMYLELHPKLTGGDFFDKTKRQLITRVDENKLAKEQREERSARSKARTAAETLSPSGVVAFADAMSGGNNVEWDSTQDEEILRNKIEELAETDPVYFNDLIGSPAIKYQSLVKQAMNRRLIDFDPATYTFKWSASSQPIAVLSTVEGENEIQKFGSWLIAGGTKADEVYKKLKAMVEGKKEAVA